jgi:tetratricopeptide (TPR) repeat protein
MHKFPVLSLVLASLIPLMPTTANAQITIDLLGIYQTEELCKNNPSLSDHKLCRAYYKDNPSSNTDPPAPSSTTDSTVNNLYQQGIQLLQQDNYQGSLAIFDRVIASNPNFAETYAFRALARFGLKDYQGALEDANSGIRLDSRLALAYHSRAYILYSLRDYQAALEDANQAMRLAPSPTKYVLRGGIRFALGNYQDALEDVNRAIRLDSKLALAYNARSNILLALGEEQEALEDADWAEKLAKTGDLKRLAAIYGQRSNVYYELGNVEKAIGDARTAIALNGESGEAMLNLAVMLHARGDRQKSFRLAEKAISLDRNVADLTYLKEMGWSKRLLADTQTFFKSPEMKDVLAAIR